MSPNGLCQQGTFYEWLTTFFAQIPESSMIVPITALIMSALETKKNTLTTERSVNWHRQNAMGRQTTQVNTQSNRKVMKVFPPERMVKYVPWT